MNSNSHGPLGRTHLSVHLMGINTFLNFFLLLILCAGMFSACSTMEKDKQAQYENALEFIKKDNR